MLTDACSAQQGLLQQPHPPHLLPPISGNCAVAPSSPSLPFCHPPPWASLLPPPLTCGPGILPPPLHSAAMGNAVTQGSGGLQGWGGQGQVFTDSGDCETRAAPAVLHAQVSRAGRVLGGHWEGLEMEGKTLGEAQRLGGRGRRRGSERRWGSRIAQEAQGKTCGCWVSPPPWD